MKRVVLIGIAITAALSILNSRRTVQMTVGRIALESRAGGKKRTAGGARRRSSEDAVPHNNYSDVFAPSAPEGAAADAPPPESSWLLPPYPYQYSRLPEAVIPRIVNKIYFQKRSGYPSATARVPGLVEAHRSWHEMNPGYDIRYFDLALARRYLDEHFHPVFLRAFDCLQAFAGKSDLFRMALLYREGGWHSDWKQICKKDRLLDAISNETDFFGLWELGKSDDVYPHRCVQNSFVGAVPRHPIIAKMIQLILLNVQTSHYAEGRLGALDSTSVCIFGRAVHESESERNSTQFESIAGEVGGTGKYRGFSFFWRGELIIFHKCMGCGATQKWEEGNDYYKLHEQKKYYCEDAASLFQA